MDIFKNIIVSLCAFILVISKHLCMNKTVQKLPTVCWGHHIDWPVVRVV